MLDHPVDTARVGRDAASVFDEAVASLLEVVAEGVESPDIERYKSSIRGNATYIRSLATSAQPTKQTNARQPDGNRAGFK